MDISSFLRKNRNILLVVLVSPILGLAAGTMSNYLFRQPPTNESPEFVENTKLNAKCIGGQNPQIVLSWEPGPDALEVAIRKQMDDGEEDFVFVDPELPFKTFSFTDEQVSPGHFYTYHARTGGNGISNKVIIQTSAENCQ